MIQMVHGPWYYMRPRCFHYLFTETRDEGTSNVRWPPTFVNNFNYLYLYVKVSSILYVLFINGTKYCNPFRRDVVFMNLPLRLPLIAIHSSFFYCKVHFHWGTTNWETILILTSETPCLSYGHIPLRDIWSHLTIRWLCIHPFSCTFRDKTIVVFR